jgi:hypothetical protein
MIDRFVWLQAVALLRLKQMPRLPRRAGTSRSRAGPLTRAAHFLHDRRWGVDGYPAARTFAGERNMESTIERAATSAIFPTETEAYQTLLARAQRKTGAVSPFGTSSRSPARPTGR